MSILSTLGVGQCDSCDDRTPQRQLRAGTAPSLVALPIALAFGAWALFAGEQAVLCALGSLLSLAIAIVVLRRPSCERCHGKAWMARHPKRADQAPYVTFYNFVERYVFATRRPHP